MTTKSLDPSAALVSAVVMVAGFTGLASRMNMTADDVAALLGAAMTIAAVLRKPLERAWAWLERRVPWLREPVPAPVPTVNPYAEERAKAEAETARTEAP